MMLMHKQSISVKYFTVNCSQFLYSLLLFYDYNMYTLLNLNFLLQMKHVLLGMKDFHFLGGGGTIICC